MKEVLFQCVISSNVTNELFHTCCGVFGLLTPACVLSLQHKPGLTTAGVPTYPTQPVAPVACSAFVPREVTENEVRCHVPVCIIPCEEGRCRGRYRGGEERCFLFIIAPLSFISSQYVGCSTVLHAFFPFCFVRKMVQQGKVLAVDISNLSPIPTHSHSGRRGPTPTSCLIGLF